jgi:hypothetical protein
MDSRTVAIPCTGYWILLPPGTGYWSWILRPPGFEVRIEILADFFIRLRFYRRFVHISSMTSSTVNKFIVHRNGCQHLAIYTVRSAEVFGKIYLENVHKKSKQINLTVTSKYCTLVVILK